MSLEKASISWSAKQLKNMIASGKIDFNHIIQRSYVWERKRKSALIESMIIGYPIPPVFAKRSDDGTGKRGGNIYAIMDGKQRLSTVAQFLNDEFALSDLPPVSYMDEANGGECEADISGMKFSELPETLQDHLNSVIFSVTYFDNLSKEEERELFRYLINVSGIGGKLALSVLSTMPVSAFCAAIATNDIKAISRINGIGKRTAERLVVELRDKLSAAGTGTVFAASGEATPAVTAANEAALALEQLGFKRDAIDRTLKALLAELPASEQTSEKLLRQAIIKLNF